MHRVTVPLYADFHDRRQSGLGIVMMSLLGMGTGAFTFEAFLAGAFLNAIPGIVLWRLCCLHSP